MTRRTFIRESAASALMAMTGGCIIADKEHTMDPRMRLRDLMRKGF